jgi:hypothetical protein
MLPIPRWKDGLLWIFGILLLAAFLGVFAPKDEVRAQIGPPNQVQCNNQAILEVGFTGSIVLQAGVPGKVIFVCGWHVTNTAAAGTFAIQTGTGALCGTNTKKLTPTSSVTSSAPSGDHVEFAHYSGAAGADLCATVSAVTITVLIWYGQF